MSAQATGQPSGPAKEGGTAALAQPADSDRRRDARRRHLDLGAGQERHQLDDEHRPPAADRGRRGLRQHLRRGALARAGRATGAAGARGAGPPGGHAGRHAPRAQEPLGAARAALHQGGAGPGREVHRRLSQPRGGAGLLQGLPRKTHGRLLRPVEGPAGGAHAPGLRDVLPRGGRVQGDAGHVLRLRGQPGGRCGTSPTCCCSTTRTSSAAARRSCAGSPTSWGPRRPRRSGRRSRSTPPSSG